MDQIDPNLPKMFFFINFLKFITLDFADFTYSSSFPLCSIVGLKNGLMVSVPTFWTDGPYQWGVVEPVIITIKF